MHPGSLQNTQSDAIASSIITQLIPDVIEEKRSLADPIETFDPGRAVTNCIASYILAQIISDAVQTAQIPTTHDIYPAIPGVMI